MAVRKLAVKTGHLQTALTVVFIAAEQGVAAQKQRSMAVKTTSANRAPGQRSSQYNHVNTDICSMQQL
jgi:hypothetical protein